VGTENLSIVRNEQYKLLTDNYNFFILNFCIFSLVVPLSSPGCEYQFGIYPKSACSTTYLKCAHGVAYEAPCEAGLAYDEKNHACNWPDLLLDRGCKPEGFFCSHKYHQFINNLFAGNLILYT